jgi:hypothetical protein
VKIQEIRQTWLGVAVLASFTAITAGLLFSQGPATARGDNGSRAITVVHLPPPHFTDVSGAAVTQSNYLFAQGITPGCGATKFCPDENLDRSTAAVLIIRAIFWSKNGVGSANPDNFTYKTSPYFTDVPATHPSFKWIQEMKDLGITSGCTATLYCPDSKVQNFEMAIFAARARQFLQTGLATPRTFSFNSTPYFGDETPTSDPTHFPYIQWAAEFGVFGMPAVSAGCSSGNFCAMNYTTRAQSLPYITRGIMGELSF